MRTKLLLPLLVLLLACVACNKVDNKLKELEQKPKATDVGGAKVLFAEAHNFRRYIEDSKNNLSPSKQQLDRANALERKRRNELVRVAGKGIFDTIKGAVDSLLGGDDKSGKGLGIDVGKVLDKTIDKVLGVNDPRMKKFGCDFPEGVDVFTEGASKYCK